MQTLAYSSTAEAPTTPANVDVAAEDAGVDPSGFDAGGLAFLAIG